MEILLTLFSLWAVSSLSAVALNVAARPLKEVIEPAGEPPRRSKGKGKQRASRHLDRDEVHPSSARPKMKREMQFDSSETAWW